MAYLFNNLFKHKIIKCIGTIDCFFFYMTILLHIVIIVVMKNEYFLFHTIRAEMWDL